MNTNHNVPNRIKQSGQCCDNCGKSFKKRENLTKHLLICDFLRNSKNNSFEEAEIPSPHIMFQMLVELGKKYNSLEEKLEKMTYKKKDNVVNVVDWLNAHVAPSCNFENFTEFMITTSDLEFIMDNSFYDTMHGVFSRSFQEGVFPIYACGEKTNTLFVFQDGWCECSRELLIKFLNKVHMKFIDAFYSWKKIKIVESSGSMRDKLETSFDKATIKLMGVDFRADSVFSKMRGLLFHLLKKDLH